MLFISGNVPLSDQANANNITICVIETFLYAPQGNNFLINSNYANINLEIFLISDISTRLESANCA